MYNNTQYSNLSKDPGFPYGYPHLRGMYPQTMYPYDSVYDNKYMTDVSHPKYKYFGNMEYPYWVQRHNRPQVFTNPKPTSWSKNEGFVHKISNYPPNIYWYPNPTECRDACGGKRCGNYYQQKNDFLNCQRCQLVKYPGPMCWDRTKQMCVKCPKEQALAPCEQSYGCSSPLGFPNQSTPPINPLYTGCANCH